ncbi:MAG: aspartate--tRNA(Asn) ligase [Candidatus Methanomethylicota archaeon]|uniref:Aspartate--tRNA(Asp/Asn) ligase n=1 Tax=Thermoproteota archaeon TaxID=2056631 RepID=A0A497F8J9_9CREN|nr:MAG: aspartate--tRNA(Asn) ligase [Candidatus Verstraetearchaeota archaeon]
MPLDDLGSWRRTHYTSQITPDLDGEEVIILGWVLELRDLGGIKFLILRDREGTVQVTMPKKLVAKEILKKVKELKRESVIGVRGIVRAMPSAPRRVEVIPVELKILNTAKSPLPIDTTGRVPADLDTRLNARILDLRVPENLAIFKIHHTALNAIREFLIREGFIEVVTPKILATATEGGAALFPVAYFEKEAFLAQSPQLYKEILTSVFEKVFEIAQFYRAEESDTTYHLNEFISVDIEVAFAEAKDVMEVLEQLVVHVIREVKEKCESELKLLGRELEAPKMPFKRITYDEALEILREHNFRIEWGEDLPTPANRKLGEIFDEPYFITDWPRKLKPFYIKPKEENPKITESFDLNWSWLELASGGTRIHRKDMLVERLREQNLNPEKFEPFLTYFEYGMPPHAGWGMGFQRFLMVITGRRNIREVTLFPRDKNRLVP